MIRYAFYCLVFLGSALMVYNIYGFISFSRFIKSQKSWKNDNKAVDIPVILVILFLLGYLIIGFFGHPDLVVGGILFGGSIFVFIMYLLLFRITSQLLESERHEAELMAVEKSNQEKMAFLSGFSHEMRTPMNVIIGLDSLALKNPDLQAETRDQLEKIGYSARHLLGLINNSLEMNSLLADDIRVREEPFSLTDILGQVNAITETLCTEKGLHYEVSISRELADSYIGDEMLVKHVLLIILENAVKYTDSPGNVRFSVSEASAGRPHTGPVIPVAFEIEDTGVGISAEFLPRIFDLFSREDSSATSRFGGSGLSLSVAKRMTALLDGTIDVQSEKDKGSIFTVVIPLLISEQEKESDGPVDEVSLEGLHILVVDDIEENAEIVSDLLELEGAECEHAENGQIAVDMVSRSPEYYYDVILMDLRMPVMDGLESSRQIRRLPRSDAEDIPIIALTANAYQSDVEDSLAAGMNAHMAKPADADMLYAMIRQYISEKGKRH